MDNNNNRPNENFKKPYVNSSSEEDILSRTHVNQNQPYQQDSNNNNFIRRLFACGGYCARSSKRNSGNVSSSASAYGLSKSTTAIRNNSPQNLSFLNQNKSSPKSIQSNKIIINNRPHNNYSNCYNSNNNNNDSQFHSELNLNEIKKQQKPNQNKNIHETNNNSKQQSYETIIDKILSTPIKLKTNNSQNTNFKTNILKNAKKSIEQKSPIKPTFKPRKNLLNENLKKIESENHKLFKKGDIGTDNANTDKGNSNPNIVLPVLKINDINVLVSQNNSPSHQHSVSDISNQNLSLAQVERSDPILRLNINTNEEDSDGLDEEEDEETCDEDDEIEDIGPIEREVLKALRKQREDEFGLYQDLEDDEQNEDFNLYCNHIQNENGKFDNKHNKNKMKLQNSKNSDKIVNGKNELENSISQNKANQETTRVRRKSTENDDELVDSNRYFNSLQHFQLNNQKTINAFKSSMSNYSFKKTKLFNNSEKSVESVNYENLSSANNGANLFVLLAANRKKSTINEGKININSSLEKFETKSPVKIHSESNFLSPYKVPSASLNNNLLNSSHPEENEQGSFIRQTSHEPISKKNAHINNNINTNANRNNMAPISSVSVSTTNTSDSNITTSHSLNLPQNMLESMSQVSSNYSIDKSSSTLAMREVSEAKKTLKKSSQEIDLEESEESDVLNEIFKVNQWLRDNHRNKNSSTIMTQLMENKFDESQNQNQNSIESILSNTLSEVNNEDEYDEGDQVVSTDMTGNKGCSGENNDSAIDISSYGSVSNLSKVSSKTTRVKWQSFTKYYRLNLQHNATLSKYQISTISCEQLMALRKLALIQFSKLLERQHSSMIRTLRLFSKKRDLAEFQRVYDSIDSLTKSESSKLKVTSNFKDLDIINNGMFPESVIIDTKKISHQLGAQIGAHPTNEITSYRKRRKNKLKKLEQQLINEKLNVLPKSNSNIFQETEICSNESKINQLNTSGHVEYKNVNDNLKNTIFNNSNKTSRVVFGVPLNTIIQHTGQALPQRILEAMKFIRKIAQHEVGIFRKNGVKTRITKLKELIDKNEFIHFQSSDFTVFDVADMIKLYFRELPECLLTNKLSDILLTNYNKILPEERKIILQQVMLLIPDENRLVLQTLLLFLSEISKYNKINQMTRSNLAVCFSPVIFRFSLEKKANLKQAIKMDSNSAVNYSPKGTNQNVGPSMAETSIHMRENSNTSVSDTPASLPLDISLPLQASKSNNFLNDNSTNSGTSNDTKTNEPLSIANNVRKTSDDESYYKKQISIENKDFSSSTVTEEVVSKTDFKVISELNSTSSNTNANSQSITITQLQQNTVQNSTNSKQNYKRKYSEKINRAASSLVNFGAELSSTKPTGFFTDSFKENLENMSKVIQLCVSDMIKYSMDLFIIPVENFEKLNPSEMNSIEPPKLDYFYDIKTKQVKNAEFFKTKFNIDKTFWSYQDKFEDVSIYFFKTDQSNTQNTNANQFQSYVNNNQLPMHVSSSNSNSCSSQNSHSMPSSAEGYSLTALTSVVVPRPDSFFNKLKLWKCCTLVKTRNLTLEKIIYRIKNERQMWDDDFKEGKVLEVLDENTELYKYVISFMPPHPSREFFEIRQVSMQKDNDTAILTSSSFQSRCHEKSKDNQDVEANLLVSKYVIEKLIANDTMTTFKITHFIKLDYKGYTLEFYNKTFGYLAARLLYNLKVSLTNENKS